MALINVRRIIIEEVSPLDNKPVQGGRRFVQDCNQTVELQEYFIDGEEKHYTNDRQTVAYNLAANLNYGYDINVSFLDFDLSLYAFLSNNVFADDGYSQTNLFGNGSAPYGNNQISYNQSLAFIRNSKIWGIEHIPPPESGTGMYSTGLESYHGFLRSEAITDPEYPGAWSIYTTTSSYIRGTNERRRYIRFEEQIREQPVTDTVFTSYLNRLRGDVESGAILSDDERYYYALFGTTFNGYYQLQVPGVGGFNATSSYVLEPRTMYPVNDINGYCQFAVMQSYSVMAINGLNYTPTGSWRPQSIPGMKYNFFCVLESSNLVIPFNHDDTQPDKYDIARFYYEMEQLPDEYDAASILRNTYIYITLNAGARELMANMGDFNPRGSTLYTQDPDYAAQNRGDVLRFAANDDSKVLFDNLYELKAFFVGNKPTLDPNHNNTSWTLRREVTFDITDDIMLTSYVIFMPSTPWTPPPDTTPPVLRMGIPFKSPTFFTLVPQSVPLEMQNFAFKAYTRDEQELYAKDMQQFIGDGSELAPGGMKSPHSSEKTYPNLFKTTMFAERYTGSERTGYYKMEFPVCYADPPPLTIENTAFAQLQGTIHAREDFIDYQSSIYINPVDELED